MAVPNAPSKLKTSFKKARCIAPLHTSGPVAIFPDGTKLITCVEVETICTDLDTGSEIFRFAGDTQPINSLCVSPSAKHLILFSSSLSLRIYEVPILPPQGNQVQPIRVVARAHDSPVHVCAVDPTSTYLASGSADGVVKVWDIVKGYVTHVFRGHGGVVSALCFSFPQDPSSVLQEQKMRLVTASVDTRIRIFDLTAQASKTAGIVKPEAVLEGHVSVPRGLDVSKDGRWLVSGGRDSVALIWNLSSLAASRKGKGGKRKEKEHGPALVRTIPILERVEAVGLLHPEEDIIRSASASDRLRFYTGGENGVVKIWDGQEGSLLFTLGTRRKDENSDDQEQRQIVDVIYVPLTSTIVSVHADQNILFHSLPSRSLKKQLIGFNDEIVDASFISPYVGTPPIPDAHLALATNSSLIRVYTTSSFDARLLHGHSDIVLCLDHSPQGNILASGSKDRSARLWAAYTHTGTSEWGWGCVAICDGHMESVGAIAVSRIAGHDAETGPSVRPRFMFTGSQDRTIKMWDLAAVPLAYEEANDPDPVKCKSLTTHKAHEKDINSLDVSPNDKLLASGSQDRTVKVYDIEYVEGSGTRSARGEIKLRGTCRGHKRGVWTVRFGRTERVLATGSGDKTVKLWSLEDYSCVKTFEGHTNSVLRVDFINSGMQLVSSSSDGLVKLWNVMEEECVTTMDNHEDKVWAMAISADERTIVTGAADSVVTFWKDCTEEEEMEKVSKRAEMALREQDFVNYTSLQNYRKAIELALSMEQPGRLFGLFKQIRSASALEMRDIESSITGHSAVDEVIRTLPGHDLAKLLWYIRDWNAKAKTSEVAQTVLFAIVKLRSAEDVMGAFESKVREVSFDAGKLQKTLNEKAGHTGGSAFKELVDALIPYTQRHLTRMEKLVQDSYVVDFILSEMDDGMVQIESEKIESEKIESESVDSEGMDVQ